MLILVQVLVFQVPHCLTGAVRSSMVLWQKLDSLACSVLSSLVRGAEPSKPLSLMGVSVLYIALCYTGWVELLAGTLYINRLPFRDLLVNKLPTCNYCNWIAFLFPRAQLSALTGETLRGHMPKPHHEAISYEHCKSPWAALRYQRSSGAGCNLLPPHHWPPHEAWHAQVQVWLIRKHLSGS